MLEMLCKQAQVYNVQMSRCLEAPEGHLPDISFVPSTLQQALNNCSKGENSGRKSFATPHKSATEVFSVKCCIFFLIHLNVIIYLLQIAIQLYRDYKCI